MTARATGRKAPIASVAVLALVLCACGQPSTELSSYSVLAPHSLSLAKQRTTAKICNDKREFLSGGGCL